MDLTPSQHSGGGDSGWTTYLDQSYISKDRNYDDNYYSYGEKGAEQKEAEEDLSMVSDASSGPRYYEDCYEENGYCFSSPHSNDLVKKKEKKHKSKEGSFRNYQQHSCPGDTASSPGQRFSEKNYGISRAEDSEQTVLGSFSGTKFKVNKQLGLFQSSHSVKPASAEKASDVMRRRNRG